MQWVSRRPYALPRRRIEEILVGIQTAEAPFRISSLQCMHSFQIPSNTDQTPFTFNCAQAAQQELPESLYLFDDAKHRFHRGFAYRIDCFSFLGLQPMPHRLHRSGMLREEPGPFGSVRLTAYCVSAACPGCTEQCPLPCTCLRWPH